MIKVSDTSKVSDTYQKLSSRYFKSIRYSLKRVMNQKIRIKLRSYDHNLVDKSTEKIVKTVRNSGAVVTGPIPLPTEKKIYTVLRSPHVNKKSREQFILRTHKSLIEIYTPTQKTVDALIKIGVAKWCRYSS